MNKQELKKKAIDAYVLKHKVDRYTARREVNALFDKLEEQNKKPEPSLNLDYEKAIHETIWARTDKTIEDRIKQEKYKEEIKESHKQIKHFEKEQLKTKKAKEKAEAKYKERFKLLEPSYRIVNLLRETEEKLIKIPAAYTAEELANSLGLDMFTTKESLKMLKNTDIIFRSKINNKINIALNEGMTREVVTRLLRDEVNKTLDDAKAAKKFKVLAQYLHRITRMRDKISNDEFDYWLLSSFDAIAQVRKNNHFNPNLTYANVGNNAYSEISKVIKEIEDRFGWKKVV